MELHKYAKTVQNAPLSHFHYLKRHSGLVTLVSKIFKGMLLLREFFAEINEDSEFVLGGHFGWGKWTDWLKFKFEDLVFPFWVFFPSLALQMYKTESQKYCEHRLLLQVLVLISVVTAK